MTFSNSPVIHCCKKNSVTLGLRDSSLPCLNIPCIPSFGKEKNVRGWGGEEGDTNPDSRNTATGNGISAHGFRSG